MAQLTTPIPPSLTGKAEEDVKRLKEWGTALVDELSYLFQNLDAGNVREAAAVKAENINTNSARISNAQIGALTADKLVAGVVDTQKVTVADEDGYLELSGSEIVIRDGVMDRFRVTYDKESGQFRFLLYNEEGSPTVYIGSGGDAVFTGKVDGSAIYGSTIIGTDSASYAEVDGGVFVQLDPKGMKLMQDVDGKRKQKVGLATAEDGTAYLVLGEGNGGGKHNINGVVYTNGTFKIEKNESYANMGLVGYKPFITFWEESGRLELSGEQVLINGVNLAAKISQLESAVEALRNS